MHTHHDFGQFLWILSLWRECVECDVMRQCKFSEETTWHSKTIEVPLVENCTWDMIELSLMHPPFWFSMLKYKQATLILLEGNLRSLTPGSLIISSKCPYMVPILDPSASNMQEHINLIDRLTDPSDHLINHISHPPMEQTLTELNTLCFICVWVHSFRSCNPHFCKKLSPIINGPSEVQSQTSKAC